MERQVEWIYDKYSFPPDIRERLENWLKQNIEMEREKYATELDGIRREKDKLERQRKKLLEAHFNDAISLDLLKTEQQKIAKQLAAVDHQLKIRSDVFDTVFERLSDAMELVEDCGTTYRKAGNHIKKMMNQAIFTHLWVEEDGNVTPEFAKPFDMIVKSAKAEFTCSGKKQIRGAVAHTDLPPTSIIFSNYLSMLES